MYKTSVLALVTFTLSYVSHASALANAMQLRGVTQVNLRIRAKRAQH